MTSEPNPAAIDAQLETISVLGHELRRPLTVIRGAATLMLDDAGRVPTEYLLPMLALIDANVEEMSELIEDVLLMVHLEAGDLRLIEEPIEVAGLVEAAVERERGHTGEHPVTILGAAPGLQVEGDRDRAVRALRALLHNAARFSPPAAPIEVTVAPQDGHVRFEVADQGPGIPAADRERAFRRFLQLEPGQSGLGLGLYLVRGLARAMGGEAGTDDRPGGGFAVWFTLRRRG
ncbi:MAG TPA: HAMP domain-containing sensor histidine kinase [Candidatus Dormibacteraeota bacterium]